MKLTRLIQTIFLLLWLGIGPINAQFDISITTQAPSCNGYSDGLASVMVDGGTEPYSYEWSNGDTTSIIYGMTVGDFSVTVTDVDGVSMSANTTIVEPEPIVSNIELIPAANICDGTNLGLIAPASGGTPPYTFQWSTGAVGETIENLEPGTYTVTTTDANNCLQTDIYIIEEPFEVGINTIDIICANFCDGSAEAAISGGTAPYAFDWSNGGNSEVIDLLAAGEYSVTVTDGNGCSLVAVGTISEPQNMFLDVTVDGSCEEEGLITANASASGGTPPYTFTWSNGDVGAQTSNLDRGTTYFVTLTDANGCNIDEQISIPLLPGLVIFAEVENATCNSGDGGSISVTADGGTEPYLYAWSNGASGSTISNLMAGMYSVTATDVNGCKGIDSLEVSAGDSLRLFTNMVNASCPGVNNGMANVLAEGGQSPYSYQWNDSQNQTGVVAINLAPGTYMVTVTDRDSCMGTGTVVVGADVEIDVSIDFEDPTCQEATNGNATATASGGIAPYTYIWTNGDTTNSIIGLVPDTYMVTVTDFNGCKAEATVTLEAETSLSPDFTIETSGCDENNNITVTLTDATLDEVSNWKWTINGEVSDEQDQVIVIPATIGDTLNIELEVSTEENCVGTTTDQLVLDAFVFEMIEFSDVMGCVGDEVQVETNANPNPSLSYSWMPESIFSSGENTPTPDVITTNSIDTTATVTVIDSLNCRYTENVDITIIEEIMPDPSAISTRQCDGTSVEFSHDIEGVAYVWDFGDGTTSSAQDTVHVYEEAGMYQVTLSTTVDCASSVMIQLEVFEAAEASFMTNFEDCTDGVISFTNTSNVPEGATYKWNFSNGDSSIVENPTVILEQSETITATLNISFGEDCEISTEQEVTINVPPVIDLRDTLVCAGEMTFLNEDGEDIYTYTWDPEINGNTNIPNPMVMPEETTTYSVTVADASGECVVMDQMTVEVPPAIEADSLGNIDQCDDAMVTFTANSAQAVEYQWFSDADLTLPIGDNDATLEYIPEGRDEMFYIQYTDLTGCTRVDTVTVSNNAPNVELMADPNLCAGDEIQLESTNLIESDELTFDWTPADLLDDNTSANPIAMPVDTTTYFVSIFNQFGCSMEDSLTINVIDLAAELQATANPTTIRNGESTNLLATPDAEKYDYVWTAVNTNDLSANDIPNPQATPVVNSSGTDPVTVVYNVMITDDNGCVADRDVEVRVLQSNCVEPFIFLPNAFTPNGDDVNDVLFVRGYSITRVFLIIYNRWGEKVFETNKIDKGWDGRHKNELVTPDVYGYYLEVDCFGGETFTKKGNITVLK